MQAIYFDMDGTLFDLYSIDNWLTKLHNNDPSPYKEAAPMVNMQILANICEQFISQGITIGVISWLPLDGTKEYNKLVRQAKKDAINKYLPYVNEIHIVKYGTPKHYVAKYKDAILVDDNENVRNSWHGKTIDAKADILQELYKYLEN